MFFAKTHLKLVPPVMLGGILVSQAVVAQGAREASAPRPRIGLVLGGGGAMGAAHVGVLEVLDELRIPVDCVAGTSMGALVGAALAAGNSPANIQDAMLEIDWSRIVGGQGRRDILPINRKTTDLTYSNSLELGIANGGIRAPGGLIQTQDIEDEIRRLVSGARQTQDFDDLPIPFRAVATEMLSGEMLVLDSGDLSVAMRASMALPGVFAPVVIDDRVLSDGGLTRNVPVDVARELCADVVIAVWMSNPPPGRAELNSALALFGRSLEVMIGTSTRVQIASLGEQDVAINVPMEGIGPSDFQRVPEAVALGRNAAASHREELVRYALSEDEYRVWSRAVRRNVPETSLLAEVRVLGLNRVSPEHVRAQLRYAVPGATVSTEQIEADTERVYAMGDFERVEHRLTGPAGGRVLEIEPVEKALGPDFLRFDFGISTDGEGDLLAILRADHTRTWVNARGGQWHNGVQLGSQSFFGTDLYQPLDVRQRFFVHPIAMLESNREDLYLDGDRVARYFVRQLYGQVDLGLNLGTRAQVRLGLRRGVYEVDLDTGIPGLPEADNLADTSLQLRATYDTRDSVGLPTRGTFLNARYARSQDWLGGNEDYELLEGVLSQAFNVRGNSLSLMLGGASTLSGDVPSTENIQLGGIRTFPGLRPGELRGNSYWFAGTSYAWQLLELQPLFGQAVYAGLRLQAGEMHDRADSVDDGTLYGISASVSGRTPVGPFLLSLGFVDNGSWLLQFTLGRPLAEGSLLDELH